METIGVEEMTPIDGQVVTFSNDIFNTSRMPVYIGPNTATAITTDGIPVEEIGMTYVIPYINIVQDMPLQQPLIEAVYNDGVTNNHTIFIDSQLATVANGQFVFTEDGLLTTAEPSVLEKETLLTSTHTLVETSTQIHLNSLNLNCLTSVDSSNVLVGRLAETEEPTTISSNDISSPANELIVSSESEKVVTEILPPIREGPHKCQICSKEFKSWVQYNKHKGMHMYDKPHHCSQCRASFNHPSNLTLHLALHKNDCLECPECSKRFSRLASLKAHIMLHEREESLFCIECGDEFSSQVLLDQHVKYHEEEWVKPVLQMKIYQCPHCDRQYSKSSVLKEHMKDHYKVKEKLSARSYKRALKRGLFLHRCDICQKAFQKPSQLLRHKRIHTGEKPFKCGVCSSAFNQKGSLSIHMESTHKGMRPYHCEFCSSTFSQKGNLRAHVLRLHAVPHSDEVVYRCSDCPCVFRKLGSLNAHINRMHNSSPKAKPDINPVPTLSVEKESTAINQSGSNSDKENDDTENGKEKVYQSYVTIANKMEDGTISHTTIKQRRMGSVKWHQCSHCSKEFKKPSDLVRHLRIHTREKPYKCKHCLKAFAVRSTLVSHIRTHSGVKNYNCNICNGAYSSLTTLKAHTKIHLRKKKPEENEDIEVIIEKITDNNEQDVLSSQPDNVGDKNQNQFIFEEPILVTDNGLIQVVGTKNSETTEDNADRPHRCNFCSSSFRKSNHLKAHLRMHTGEKPFKCHICSRSFICNGHLKIHMRTHFNVKSHKCEDCGKYFSTKGSLQRHLGLHNAGRPYLCPYCSKTYKTHSSCRKHIRTHKVVVRQVIGEDGQTFEVQHIMNDKQINNKSIEITAVEPIVEEIPLENTAPTVETLVDSATLQEQYILPMSVDNNGDIRVASDNNTLHADASGTITLPNLVGQDQLTQESMREIEETLNHQLFGTASDLGLVEDKEQSVLFDQGFENCVFSSIDLQSDSLELNQTLTPTNLPVVLSQDKEQETFFGCINCESLFKTNEELEAHSLTHNAAKEKPTCVICDKTFLSMASYKLHEKSHGREKEHECYLCGARFTLSFSLSRHMSIHTSSEDKTYHCTTCGASYRTEAQLRRHSNEHRVPRIRPRRRRGSPRQLTEEETLQLANQLPHQANSVSEKILIAAFAERDRISELKHSKDKFEQKPLHLNQCKYCPKSFKKPSDLVRHLRIHTGERPYRCDFCNKCFTVKSTLDCHIKTHTNQKQCTCHVCGSMFATNGSLKIHMRLHTGSRPFRCPFCDKRFRTSGHRKAHLLSHVRESAFKEYFSQEPVPNTNEEEQDISVTNHDFTQIEKKVPVIEASKTSVSIFVCSYCNKMFYKNSALTRHKRVHTGERPFKCKVCDKTFSQKSSLQIHWKRHTGERPWPCPECPMAFSQKGNLKTHIRRTHQFSQHAKLKTEIQPVTQTKIFSAYTIDIGDKTLVDIEKVVSDLFPQMKSSSVKQSSVNLGETEIIQ